MVTKAGSFSRAKVLGAVLDSGILSGYVKQAKDMPHFTEQDRPEKVKDVYKAIKREHPEYPAEMKARIASSKGEGGGGEGGEKDFTKRKGKYVKKGSDLFMEFLVKAMTKSGAVEIIRNASDPELAARVVFSIRNAAQKRGS